MKPGDLFRYPGVMNIRRGENLENPLLVFLCDHPTVHDCGIFLSPRGMKILVEKKLLEEIVS